MGRDTKYSNTGIQHSVITTIIILLTGIAVIAWNIYSSAGSEFLYSSTDVKTSNSFNRFSSYPLRSSIRTRSHPGPEWVMDSSEFFRNPASVTIPHIYRPGDKKYMEVRFDREKVLKNLSYLKIHFLAVNSPFNAYVNSYTEGRHKTEWLSYRVQVPRRQLRESNSLTLALDYRSSTYSKLLKAGEPLELCNGVASEVVLESIPPIYLDQVRHDANFAGKSIEIRVSGKIAGKIPENATLEIEVEIFPRFQDEEPYSVLQGKALLENGSAKFNLWLISDKLILWNPHAPVIHDMVVRLKRDGILVDDIEIPIGLRQVEYGPEGFTVNSVPVPLNGTTEFNSNLGNCPADYDEMEKAVGLLKREGTRLVRLAEPPHPYLLDLLDKEGILAIEELPVGPLNAGTVSTNELAKMMRDMITRDRYHPSIIAWGMGEFFSSPDSDKKLIFASEITRRAKKLDDRPVYIVTRTPYTDIELGGYDVDFAGYVTYPWDDPDKLASEMKTAYPGKNLFAISSEPMKPTSFEVGRFIMRSDWPTGKVALNLSISDEKNNGWLFLSILIMWGYLLLRPWLKEKLEAAHTDDEQDSEEKEEKEERLFDKLSNQLKSTGSLHTSFSAASVATIFLSRFSSDERLWWALSPLAGKFRKLFEVGPTLTNSADIGFLIFFAAISAILFSFSRLLVKIISGTFPPPLQLRAVMWISIPYIMSLLALLLLNDMVLSAALFSIGYVSKKMHLASASFNSSSSIHVGLIASFISTVIWTAILYSLASRYHYQIIMVVDLFLHT